MSLSDDYLLVTDSHDLDLGPLHSGREIHHEDDTASLNALQMQGISILNESPELERSSAEEDFSHELMNQAGIEIVSSEEGEDSLL